MNLKNIVRSLKKENQYAKNINFAELADALNVLDAGWYSEEFESRFSAWYIKSLWCSDRDCGLAAYFLDGEFIATGEQLHRKSKETFKFVDSECVDRLRALFYSEFERQWSLKIEYLDMNAEMDTHFSPTYPTETLGKNIAIWFGNPVTITGFHMFGDSISITLPDGTHHQAKASELLFKINVNS